MSSRRTVILIILIGALIAITTFLINANSNSIKILIWTSIPTLILVVIASLILRLWQIQPQIDVNPISPRIRKQMIEKVRAQWIKGVLEPSEKASTFIHLTLVENRSALNTLTSDDIHANIAPMIETNILNMYENAAGKLLILGEAGSGKTILLLEIARALLNQANIDDSQLIPVIFRLASWGGKRRQSPSLKSWMVDQLYFRYNVPLVLSHAWIEANLILPLLDGLDEVRYDRRSACVLAINDFQKETSLPLVVTSRTDPYMKIPDKLELNRAIIVLSDEQIPDKTKPSDERQAELHAAYKGGTDMPYRGVKIRTLGELEWICEQRGWSGEYRLPEGKARPNLRGAVLSKANLRWTGLLGANLIGADLSGANLSGANLSQADLSQADLTEAYLEETDLSRASLLEAHLKGTDLRGANLEMADFRRSEVSRTTRFVGSSPKGIKLNGIEWNDFNFRNMEWEPLNAIGDEDLTTSIGRDERIATLQEAQAIYRELEIHLLASGIDRIAVRFARRRNYLDRPILRYQRRWRTYFSLALLDLIVVAGSSLVRLALAYITIIAGFTYLYAKISSLNLRECVVLSLTSFHGRGFFGLSSLGDTVSLYAAIEGVLGLFVEALLISFFTGAVARRQGEG